MIKYVLKKWKQLFCKHKWIQKGEIISTSYCHFSEYRCSKCKQIKQNLIVW